MGVQRENLRLQWCEDWKHSLSQRAAREELLLDGRSHRRRLPMTITTWSKRWGWTQLCGSPAGCGVLESMITTEWEIAEEHWLALTGEKHSGNWRALRPYTEASNWALLSAPTQLNRSSRNPVGFTWKTLAAMPLKNVRPHHYAAPSMQLGV